MAKKQSDEDEDGPGTQTSIARQIANRLPSTGRDELQIAEVKESAVDPQRKWGKRGARLGLLYAPDGGKQRRIETVMRIPEQIHSILRLTLAEIPSNADDPMGRMNDIYISLLYAFCSLSAEWRVQYLYKSFNWKAIGDRLIPALTIGTPVAFMLRHIEARQVTEDLDFPNITVERMAELVADMAVAMLENYTTLTRKGADKTRLSQQMALAFRVGLEAIAHYDELCARDGKRRDMAKTVRRALDLGFEAIGEEE